MMLKVETQSNPGTAIYEPLSSYPGCREPWQGVRNAATSTISKQKFRFQMGPVFHWVSLHDRRCRVLHLASHLVELHLCTNLIEANNFGTLNSTKLSFWDVDLPGSIDFLHGSWDLPLRISTRCHREDESTMLEIAWTKGLHQSTTASCFEHACSYGWVAVSISWSQHLNGNLETSKWMSSCHSKCKWSANDWMTNDLTMFHDSIHTSHLI